MEKKKIGDMTVREVKEYCNSMSCGECPVHFFLCDISSQPDSVLDEEIEIEVSSD